jgi:hypothetical protein
MNKQIPIEGPHRIPGFNGVGEINLEDYNTEGILPPKILSGKFSHIGTLDLNTVDENHPNWENLAIREQGNTNDRIGIFENAFEVEGFKTNVPPILLGTNQKPIDGRGRAIAAKRRGEKQIPAFYYVIGDDSEKNRVTDGLMNNLRHPSAFQATMESIVVGGLFLIKCGELNFDESSIRDYLHNDLEVQNKFSKGNITKIVNAILARGKEGGDPLVYTKDREKWITWCNDAGMPINDDNGILCCVDGHNYPFRHWGEHIIPRVTSNKPAKLILYTKRHVPAEARRNMKKYVVALQYLLESSYMMVERDYASDWPMGELKLPVKTVPYEIYGCIPQIVGKHDSYRNSKRFVDIENY